MCNTLYIQCKNMYIMVYASIVYLCVVGSTHYGIILLDPPVSWAAYHYNVHFVRRRTVFFSAYALIIYVFRLARSKRFVKRGRCSSMVTITSSHSSTTVVARLVYPYLIIIILYNTTLIIYGYPIPIQ